MSSTKRSTARSLSSRLPVIAIALAMAAALLAGGPGSPIAAAEEVGELEFVQPDSDRLEGLVDLEVAAPAGTTAVRFFIDDMQLAELTDEYATETETEPVWQTATDVSWLRPGAHMLRAEADTPDGVVSAERRVLTFRDPPAEGTTPLTGAWRFAADGELPEGALEGETPAAVQPDYQDREFANVMVPNSLGAVADRYNDWDGLLGVYRRVVKLGEPAAGEQTAIVLESCYWHCRVFVNGQQVGESRGGHLPERLDITDAVVAGDNTVAVVVDHRNSTMGELARIHDGYWNWGGLLQEVRIERTPETALVDLRAEGTSDGSLTLRAMGVNGTGAARSLQAEVQVDDSEGEPALPARQVTIDVPAEGGDAEPVRLAVDEPQLWDIDNPRLYTVRLIPEQGGELVERTGFRDIEVDGADVLLNGEVVEGLQGFNRHQDYPGLGRTQPDGLARRELTELHGKGFGIYRPAHYPATPGELDVADELGLLVIEQINVISLAGDALEAPEVKEFGVDRLTRLIRRDRSHPSIIAWSVGNENRTEDSRAVPYVRDTIAAGRELDPTRLYTHVSNRALRDLTYEYQDLVAVNAYAGWYTDRGATELGSDPVESIVESLDQIQDFAGNKPLVMTEYGAEAVKDRPGTGKGTELYQAHIVDEHNRLLDDRPHFLGKMYWTATEFWCRPGWNGGNPDPVPPFHAKGLRTLDRQDKLAWRVMFSPVRITDISVLEAPAGQETTVTARITVADARGQSTSGTLVVEPPSGFDAEPAEQPFSVEPGGQTMVDVTLRGTLEEAAESVDGMVRAVVDDNTEARPQLLTVRRANVLTHPASDAFDATALDDDWTIERENPDGWSLEDRPGSLLLFTLPGDQNLLLRDNTPDSDFTATADVTAELDSDGQRIALIAHAGDGDYVDVAVGYRDGGPSIEFVHERGGQTVSTEVIPEDTGDATLRLVRRGEVVSAEYSLDDTVWYQVGEARLPGSVRVGLQATGGQSDPPPGVSAYVDDLQVLVAGVLTVDRVDPVLPLIGIEPNTVTVQVSNARDVPAEDVTATIDVPDGWTAGTATTSIEPFGTAQLEVPVAPPLVPTVDVTLTANVTAENLPVFGSVSTSVITTPPGEAVALALDSGTPTSPLLDGYQPLSPGDVWNAVRGFGWDGDLPESRDRGEPRWCGDGCDALELDDLRRDFTAGLDAARETTLRVTLPPGAHQAYVLVGDSTHLSSNTTISDIDGNVLDEVDDIQPAGHFTWLNFPLDGGADGGPVDLVVSGAGNWRLNALALIPVVDGVPVPITEGVFVEGIDAEQPMIGDRTNMVDITVRNRGDEPAEVTAMVDAPDGWSSGTVTEMLEPSVSATLQVPVTPPLEPTIATLTAEVSGESVWVYRSASTTVIATPPGDSVPLVLDSGTSTSPLLDGYQRLSHEEDWDAARGFGWVAGTPDARDRGEPRWCGDACDAPELDDLRRDFTLDTSEATFRLAVPPGLHEVYVLAGDATHQPTADTVIRDVEGNVLDRVGSGQPAGQFTWLSFPLDGGADGTAVDLVISGEGGNSFWRLNALALIPESVD